MQANQGGATLGGPNISPAKTLGDSG